MSTNLNVGLMVMLTIGVIMIMTIIFGGTGEEKQNEKGKK